MKPFLFLLMLSSTFIGCQYAAKERQMTPIYESESPTHVGLNAYQVDSIEKISLFTRDFERFQDAFFVVNGMMTFDSYTLQVISIHVDDLKKYASWEPRENWPDSVSQMYTKLQKTVAKKTPIVLRKARQLVAAELKEKLWVEDIEVRHRDKTIEFEGYHYSLNRNIDTHYKAFYDAAVKYGFKKVVFSSGYESTTYTIE